MKTTTKFVGACCRWPHTPESAKAVELAAGAVDDWDAAKQAVRRHRVAPLVHLAVKDIATVPAEFKAWIKKQAWAKSRHSMQLTRDCLNIDQTFKAAGLKPLHFKGPVLAQIAYGSIALKDSHDLDIFLRGSEVPAAVALLEKAGYRATEQDTPFSRPQIEALVHNFKDLCFLSPSGTLVEVHWRFFHYKGLLDGLEDNLNQQSIAITNTASLDTFESAQMLAYLAVHGAVHYWKRIKWLADLAAFLEQFPSDERERIIAEVNDGANRDALAHALKLCDTLLGTKYDPKMSPRAQALYDHSLERIDQPDGPRESGFAAMADLFVTRHLFSRSWEVIKTLAPLGSNRKDVLAFPLPRYLNSVYLLIRVPSVLLRRLRSDSTMRN